MKLSAEFKGFATGNGVNLAVRVIIGAGFGKIVSSFVGTRSCRRSACSPAVWKPKDAVRRGRHRLGRTAQTSGFAARCAPNPPEPRLERAPRLLMGTVTEHTVRHSACPVLLIPPEARPMRPPGVDNVSAP